MALGDGRVVEHARQLVEQVLPAEGAAANRLRFMLLDHVRWNRSSQ